jgi:1-deoxy-D-xylulose-5-phosphate reductoisomerase
VQLRDAGGGRRRTVVVLGSTGSVGRQAVDILTANPDRFTVVGLAAAGTDPRRLGAQAGALGVRQVVVARAGAAEETAEHLPGNAELAVGDRAVTELAGIGADVVLNALDGAAGLPSTLAALDAGSTLALANKESLVMGGDLVTSRARPGQITPVDSEHSALAQCLRSGSAGEVAALVLTASGGPFRGRSRDSLGDVTPGQALAHPTWSMGRLVTTNSATLMNKGLEVLEAHHLFGVDYDRIRVVVHPQSVVHSMVEFTDGSTIAQASPPDMRLPIALGLGWPDRVPYAARPVDWTTAQTWRFEPVDDAAFPALGLAIAAGRAGGTAPAVLNAANEAAVAAFFDGDLSFLGIADTVGAVLGRHTRVDGPTLEQLRAADTWARAAAAALTRGDEPPPETTRPPQEEPAP